MLFFFLFFKQKTAYEMRISDWSSDVCSSDLSAGQSADFSACRRKRGVGARNVQELGPGRGLQPVLPAGLLGRGQLLRYRGQRRDPDGRRAGDRRELRRQ